MPKPNAETFRILALAHLAKKNLAQARLEIQKGLELQPNWDSLQFTAAMIDYFSGLAVPALPDRIVPWPEPVTWALVKRDDESLQRFREAARTFTNLAERSHMEQEERSTLQSWVLACFANDPERQDQAASYCTACLIADPLHYRAIIWASARKLPVDLSPSETALSALVSEGRADCSRILALLTRYLDSKRPTEALRLLESTEHQFQEDHAENLWTFWVAQTRILAGDPAAALAGPTALTDPRRFHLQAMALRALADKNGDWESVTRHLETSYATTGDAEFLLELCQLRADRQEWAYVADRAEALVKEIQTAEALRIGAISLFNARRYRLCLTLLDAHLHLCTGRRLPGELRRMRVLCQRALGALPSAVTDAELMAREDPSTSNVLALAQLEFEAGDLKGVAILARQLLDRGDLSLEQLLHLSGAVQWEDAALAHALWRRALAIGVPDELVGSALGIGYQLGLDSELRPLLSRMAELAREGRGGVRAATLDDLVAISKQHWESASKREDAYKQGVVPIHFICAPAQLPLVELYHQRLSENEASPHPLRQPFLLIRHGGRPLSTLPPRSAQAWRLNLDVTAVLLAAHLEILDALEKSFGPLRIPAPLIPALIAMRDRIAPHQPSRASRFAEIVELLDAGVLRAIDPSDVPPGESKSGTQTDPTARTALLRQAAAIEGFVIDFADSSRDSTLLNIDRSRLINCRVVTDALRHHGPLSHDDYLRALSDLGNESQQHGSQVTLPEGCSLLCLANIPEVLSQAGVLRIACERFNVFIEKREADAARAGLVAHRSQRQLVDWLGALIDRLRGGIQRGIYALIPPATTDPGSTRGADRDDPDSRCLLDLLQCEMQGNDVLWVDDRFVNSHGHRDGVPIIGINEVLRALLSSETLTETAYYRILGRLRASNARFVPFEKGEILYHLSQAQVKNGSLVETQELTTVRRYVASCLLSVDTLQRPPMPKGAANEHGELAFLLGLGRVVMDSIVGLWGCVQDTASVKARAEWLIGNVYLDHLALIKVTAIQGVKQTELYSAALTLAGLLSQGIALDSARESDQPSTRRDYFEWLDARILNRRFDRDPTLIAAVGDILKKTLLDVRLQASQRNGQSKQLGQVATSIMQRFYHDLPDSVREELSRDADFMANLGLKTLPAIAIGDLSFEAEAFFRAASEAINGRELSVRPIGTIARVRFVPSTASPSKAFTFAHPLTGQQCEIGNAELPLLLDSAAEREACLRRHREWFDCEEGEFERTLAEIVSESNPRRRIELLDSVRKSSAAVHYREVHDKLRRNTNCEWTDLTLPAVESLLRHLRVSPPGAQGPTIDTIVSSAGDALARSEGLAVALTRLASLPLSLPASLISRVREADAKEKRALLKRLIRSAGSPISQIHLIRLLLWAFDEWPASARLGRRLVRRVLSSDYLVVVEGFLAILGSTASQCADSPSSRELPPSARLIAVWAHAHTMYSIFASVGARPDWCKDFFSGRHQQASAEFFDRDFSWWLDVAHPHELTPVTFLLGGLSYAIRGKADTFLTPHLTRLCISAAFPDTGGAPVPALPLLRDATRAPNNLQSFYGHDREQVLSPLVGDEKARAFSSSALRSLAKDAIERLGHPTSTFTDWAQLHAILGELPPYEDIADALKAKLIQTDFVALLKNDVRWGVLAMHVASLQCINFNDQGLSDHLKAQLPLMSEVLASEAQTRNMDAEQMAGIKKAFFLLLDAALNISIASSPTGVRRVEEFKCIAAALLERYREMQPECRPMFQHLCDDLPITLAADLWPLVMRLRAA
jgi:tetratricopeptide (TPR) repeat protein